MWFVYRQSNPGGSFRRDASVGLGVTVWVEAGSAVEANARAEGLGVYFDGVMLGWDCRCCGLDRWEPHFDEVVDGWDVMHFPPVWSSDSDHDEKVYVHPLQGSFYWLSRFGPVYVLGGSGAV